MILLLRDRDEDYDLLEYDDELFLLPIVFRTGLRCLGLLLLMLLVPLLLLELFHFCGR